MEPKAALFQYTDAFGNIVHTFDLLKPHQSLVTRLIGEVETTLNNPFSFHLLSPRDEILWYTRQFQADPALWQYVIHRSPAVPEWQSLDLGDPPAPPSFDRKESVQNSVLKAMDWVASALKYQPGTSYTHSPLQEVVAQRQGVCQDFAHLFLALVRSWGLPSRYVMGYMDASIEGFENAKGETASHAWVEILIPGAGWRGYDATNRLCANDLYIPFAVGRDSLDAAPQRGTFKGLGVKQNQSLRVSLERKAPDSAVLSQSQQQAAQ
jgi:transglutaminase-like putative cysteine protease